MAISLGTGLALAGAGSLIGGMAAGKGAARAGASAADAQLEAARLGALASAFKPVGITTRFSRSNFEMGTDPETGLPIVESAGYELVPELAALQDQLLGAAPGALGRGLDAYGRIAPLEGAAQGLFGLGSQYLGESPEAVRQRYINQQTALLDPIRQREEERLGAGVFGRGRAGLNIGDIGQPELFSLAQARRQQDLQLGAAAEQAAQQQINFGQGLFGQGASLLGQVPAYEVAALSPFQQQLAAAQGIEALGQAPLDIGAQLGGRQAQAGQAGGALLAQGGAGAAQTRLQGQLAGMGAQYGALQDVLGMFGNPMLYSGGGGGGFGASGGYGMGALGYGLGFGINPMGQQAQMLASQWD